MGSGGARRVPEQVLLSKPAAERFGDGAQSKLPVTAGFSPRTGSLLEAGFSPRDGIIAGESIMPQGCPGQRCHQALAMHMGKLRHTALREAPPVPAGHQDEK